MPAKKKFPKRRVHIPARDLTVVSNKVFDEVLPLLRRRHSALLYLVLYDFAWHDHEKVVRATLAELANVSNLDYRTVQKCIRELELKRFIVRIEKGTRRSRTHPPGWKVPATKFNMSKQGWVPVPSFIFTQYIPEVPACTLLPLILYFQNYRKMNYAYAGVNELAARIGWLSHRRVYEALSLMGDDRKWNKLHTRLPQPLWIQWIHTSSGNFYRRYGVTAVFYCRPSTDETGKGPRELYLKDDFAEFFRIDSQSAPPPDWNSEDYFEKGSLSKSRKDFKTK